MRIALAQRIYSLRRAARAACKYVVMIFVISATSSPLLGIPAQKASPAADAPYRDPKLPIDERVADLLKHMTLEEKVDQLTWGWDGQVNVIDPTGTVTNQEARKILQAEWGTDLKVTPRESAIVRNAVQRYLRETTRLSIPALFFGEGLHGFMEYGSTSFPQAIALASTWDPALVKKVFAAVAEEARSRGVEQLFAPDLDIARDPRWGRTEETFGEDPYLVSHIGLAAIEGLQGQSGIIDRFHVLATAKHFAVHGQPEGGTNTAPGNYSERVIRENFLLPFRVAVEEAHVGSVMASYNEIDGVPSSINPWLLDRILRHEWEFSGYVTSDDNGLQMLVTTHHVAHDDAEAARKALASGVDYDLSDGSVFRTLVTQVKQGLVPQGEIDQSVARILRAKFQLGLFDNPYVDPKYAERINNNPEHRFLALEAARKAIVLLKNQGHLLPLDLDKIKSIAVIGPNAADVHLGGYSRDPGVGISVLDGIRNYVGSRAQVLYAKGCTLTTAPEGYRGWWFDNAKLVDPMSQTAAIQTAVDTARRADVVILVVGGNESTSREAWSEEHLGDRDSLDLIGAQDELVKSIFRTGKPIIVLMLNGRPLSINFIADNIPAILEGWYLGEEGGRAAAEVIFGDVNPGGKLPITFPYSVGDLPDFYNHKPSDNRSYAFSTRKPLFAFGYGLSYTQFQFSNLHVQPEQIEADGTATVSLDLANTGNRIGDEVPQLYIHPQDSSVTQPVMRLAGFERITLAPGERKSISFTVTPKMLSILNIDMQPVVEPGAYDLMVGPSSDRTSAVELRVVPNAR
jgi:beta-glucosidase